jgi:exodeoxyribonuclease V gamma subunit
MTSLRIHRARSVADLADVLARRLADAPPADPMASVDVAVASRGMERWLAQRLSATLGAVDGRGGVCANVRFPFPGSVVRRILGAVLPEAPPEADPWAPQRLVWPLLAILDDLPSGTTWEPLRAHLADGDARADRRRFPLARRIADLFDRYALHRPDMVRAWAGGAAVDADGQPLPATAAWQPPLWRLLAERIGVPSPDERHRRAVAALADGRTARPADLPDTVRVFGVLALPPPHLELLAALAGHVDVELYAVSPCARWRPAVVPPAPDNPLLAGWGMAAVAAHTALARHEPAPAARQLALGTDDAWAPAPAGPGTAGPVTDADAGPTPEADAAAGAQPSALAVLQADVRADRRRGPRAADPVPLAAHDRSVQVHACHGLMRQLEVLREVLLGLLADDPTLEPRDVVVLTPDIEAVAPLVPAVFADGGPEAGVPALPVRVADRTLRDENVVAQALGAILELVTGRAGASAVVDLLALPPLRLRFGLTPADVAVLPDWILGTGISWGIDAAHRRELIDLDDASHTWRAGLDRLVLGAAMPDDGHRMVAGVVPYDDVEGGAVDLLGRLVTATDTLFATLRGLRGARPVADWRAALDGAVDALLDPGDAAAGDAALTWQVAAVRDAIAAMASDSADADGTSSPVPLTLEEVRAALGAHLGQRSGSAHYGTGAVTFAGLVPLRNVPHRVVAVVGLDDGALPRSGHRHGFDLLAAQPRPGDPDPRVEDRALLLDAVLAAGDHLVLTYTGHDPRTNEVQQPAVPVSELLDVLDASLAVPGSPAVPARARLLVDHPLQPHSPRYFRADEEADEEAVPRAFDRRQLAAAGAALRPRTDPPAFFPAPLPPPSADELDPEVVELADLLRFLDHPVRHLLQRRVGIVLAEDDRRLEDRDPTELDGLERWKLGQGLLRRRLGGAVPPRWRELTLACGTVPVGGIGEVELDGIEELVDRLCARVEAMPGDRGPLPVDVRVDLPDGDRRRIIGSVDLIGGVVTSVNVSSLKGKHRLRAWTELLAVTAAAPDLVPSARILGKDRSAAGYRDLTLRPLVEAAAAEDDDPAALARRHLGAVVALYLRGRREPVPLLPEVSFAYADCRRKGQPGDRALRTAAKTWEGSEQYPGEQADAYVVQAYGADLDLDALAEATTFVTDVERIWTPLLTAETKTPGDA